MRKKSKRWLILCCGLWVVGCGLEAQAKEIAILYSGETHAALYHCNCPIEPDGGISRRAALLKQLKTTYPDAFLLDTGSFIAGGLLDENTQNTELDLQRSKINISAMELMKYDAVCVGDDEFNFGVDFLKEAINRGKIPLISCNLKMENILPYVIKEAAQAKFGIIGVTNLQAMQKAESKIIDPKIALSETISEVRNKGVDIIIVLSNLGEQEDLALAGQVKGIDILIGGRARYRKDTFIKVGDTLILSASWQGRKLGKAILDITDKKIKDYKVEEIRLSDKIGDDPEIMKILPRCFSDTQCKKEGSIGSCQNPGAEKAACQFIQANRVNLTVITLKDCQICNNESMVRFLEKQFPGLKSTYLFYPEAKAQKLIKEFNLKSLPVYFLGKEVEKETNFDSLKQNLEMKGSLYMLRTQFAGVAFYVDRQKISSRLDLFLSLFDKIAPSILEVTKEFNPVIHFLAVEMQGKFDAASGGIEVEEYLRSVCVQKYYPQKFWDYINCRSQAITSSWWEDCASDFDAGKIKTCARGEEGKKLLEDNISLSKELQIMFGPVYLMDNQEIFSTRGIPQKEELKKMLKR